MIFQPKNPQTVNYSITKFSTSCSVIQGSEINPNFQSNMKTAHCNNTVSELPAALKIIIIIAIIHSPQWLHFPTNKITKTANYCIKKFSTSCSVIQGSEIIPNFRSNMKKAHCNNIVSHLPHSSNVHVTFKKSCKCKKNEETYLLVAPVSFSIVKTRLDTLRRVKMFGKQRKTENAGN